LWIREWIGAAYFWSAPFCCVALVEEASAATGIIFGTSGCDVERELRAYAEVAALR
jgi:hypothetical protein